MTGPTGENQDHGACGRLVGRPCEECPDAPTQRRLGLPLGRPCGMSEAAAFTIAHNTAHWDRVMAEGDTDG